MTRERGKIKNDKGKREKERVYKMTRERWGMREDEE